MTAPVPAQSGLSASDGAVTMADATRDDCYRLAAEADALVAAVGPGLALVGGPVSSSLRVASSHLTAAARSLRAAAGAAEAASAIAAAGAAPGPVAEVGS